MGNLQHKHYSGFRSGGTNTLVLHKSGVRHVYARARCFFGQVTEGDTFKIAILEHPVVNEGTFDLGRRIILKKIAAFPHLDANIYKFLTFVHAQQPIYHESGFYLGQIYLDDVFARCHGQNDNHKSDKFLHLTRI